MSTSQDIQKSILAAIDTMAQRRIDQLQVDKTITAIIKSSVGVNTQGRKIYRVEYEGGFFNAIAQNTGDAYLPGMKVYVQIPEGNFSKEKFILGRASTLFLSAENSVVAATASNYGIIGMNLISGDKSTSFGVMSYHNIKEEKSDTNTIKHRYNFLFQESAEDSSYSILSSDLEKYKNEATAIMIRADFMTKLTQEQKEQITGEYGLVFNLKFRNLAVGLGETQGNVLDALKNKIVYEENSLKDIQATVESYILCETEPSINNIYGEEGLIDIQINKLIELKNLLKNHSKLTDVMGELIDGYQVLLEEVRDAENWISSKETYTTWINTPTDQSATKTISYFLTSAQMVGNPFSFSSWISQYAVFEIDLDNFIGIDSILLYQEGFKEGELNDNHNINEEGYNLDSDEWESSGGEDILVKNPQFYLLKPLADYNGQYQLKVEAQESNGMALDAKEVTETIVSATFLRERYENLTNNSKTTFYWFQESDSISTPNQEGYSLYGGIGWKKIENQDLPSLKVVYEDLKSYENNYRCAVTYTGEETPVVLRYDFTIYKRDGEQFRLVSSLGDKFAFDAGVPEISVQYKMAEDDIEWKNLDSTTYHFKWGIKNQNNQLTFLLEDSVLTTPDSIKTVSDFTSASNTSKLLKGVVFLNDGEEIIKSSDRILANSIKYPMSNISTNSSVTIECYIMKSNGKTPAQYNFFGKASIVLSNLTGLLTTGYRIVIVNGEQVFQYDEYGNSPTSGKVKDPQEILPLSVKLFAFNNVEIQSQNFSTRWFFPASGSLIGTSETLELNPATGLTNLFKGNEVSFNIANLYDYNALDNQIQCQVDFNNETLYGKTNFYFGKVGDNGTNGTDMVAKIVPTNESSNIYQTQPTTLYIWKQKNSSGVKELKYWSNDGVLWSDNNNKAIANSEETGLLKFKLFQRNIEIPQDDKVNYRWNIAGNPSVSSNTRGNDIILDKDTKSLMWNPTDEEISPFFCHIIKCQIVYDDKEYYAFYNLPLIDYQTAFNVNKKLEKNRISIENNYYLKDILYNADGRNPIYNQNQGLKIINLPENCTVIWEAKGGWTKEENAPCFRLLEEKDTKKENAIATIEQKNISKEAMIYILPDDSVSGSVTNNYIKATIKENGTIIAIVYAPISMTLNTFGLASLNGWDGNSVSIDEEGGYVMAPQIGAGEKDENNRFTGILMGKTETQTGSGKSSSETGLFGYSHGLQSIFLDAKTGNAIFGLPENKYFDGIVPSSSTSKQATYDEGRIELKPGGESVIAGWRFGRSSLFKSSEPLDSGTSSKKDEVPSSVGKLIEANTYRSHHLRDIPSSASGILLQSGDSPYVSIKGQPLTDDSGINFKNTPLRAGDSLEIQLDSQTPTLFTIFRHNAEDRDKNVQRTFLAGINEKGELVANVVQEPAATNNSKITEGSVTTKSSVNFLDAFGKFTLAENSDEASSYLGSMIEYNTTSIIKMFIDYLSSKKTLYITGGALDGKDEYQRPISIHGNSISLYSASSGRALTTDSYFSIKPNELKIYANSNNYISYIGNAFNIRTNGLLAINSESNSYTLTTGAQTITATGNITVNNKNQISSWTAKNYNVTASEGINLKRGSADKPNTSLELADTKIELKINNIINNKIKNVATLLLTSDTRSHTQLTSVENPITIKSDYPSGTSLFLVGKGNNRTGGSAETSNDVVIKAQEQDSTKDRYSKILLTAIGNITWNQNAYPFYLDCGNYGRAYLQYNKGSQNNTGERRRFYFGSAVEVGNGLSINGTYQDWGTGKTYDPEGGSDWIGVNSKYSIYTQRHLISSKNLIVGQNAKIKGQLNVDGRAYVTGDSFFYNDIISNASYTGQGRMQDLYFFNKDVRINNDGTGSYNNGYIEFSYELSYDDRTYLYINSFSLWSILNGICEGIHRLANNEIVRIENALNGLNNTVDSLINEFHNHRHDFSVQEVDDQTTESGGDNHTHGINTHEASGTTGTWHW